MRLKEALAAAEIAHAVRGQMVEQIRLRSPDDPQSYFILVRVGDEIRELNTKAEARQNVESTPRPNKTKRTKTVTQKSAVKRRVSRGKKNAD